MYLSLLVLLWSLEKEIGITIGFLSVLLPLPVIQLLMKFFEMLKMKILSVKLKRKLS